MDDYEVYASSFSLFLGRGRADSTPSCLCFLSQRLLRFAPPRVDRLAVFCDNFIRISFLPHSTYRQEPSETISFQCSVMERQTQVMKGVQDQTRKVRKLTDVGSMQYLQYGSH